MKVKKRAVRRVTSVDMSLSGLSANVIVDDIRHTSVDESTCSSPPVMNKSLDSESQIDTAKAILPLLEHKNRLGEKVLDVVTGNGKTTSAQNLMPFEACERMPSLLNGRNASVHTTDGRCPNFNVMPHPSTDNTVLETHIPSPKKDKGKRKMYDLCDAETPFVEESSFPLSSDSMHCHTETTFVEESSFPLSLESMHDLLLNGGADTNESRLLCSKDFTIIDNPQRPANGINALSNEVDQVTPANQGLFSFHTAQSVPTPYDQLQAPSTDSSRRPQVTLRSSRGRQERTRRGRNGVTTLRQGPPTTYVHMGRCDQICRHCK